MGAGKADQTGVPWWQTAVFYQIYPRSFLDTNGDGVGDLEGIRRRLDHLVWLGVDALWISPFYPLADEGLRLRRLRLLRRRSAVRHARRLRPPARRGPRARAARDHRLGAQPHERPAPVVPRGARVASLARSATGTSGATARRERPPNNWRAAFTRGPAWTWDEATGQWYLHLFLPEQPDLNWANPEVVAAMHDTLRFWLDRGVDGFRIDVVHCIGKDPALPDVPAERAIIPACALNDVESTHALLRDIRGVLEAYPGERVMVGEVGVPWTEIVARYYGHGDELHLAFNFPPLFAPWDGGRLARADRARGGASSIRAAPGRRGCSRITTTRATARATGARRGRAPPPCCCSGCAARPSSTPARSSGSRTRRCPHPGCSIPAAATAAAPRSPGRPDRHMVGAPGTRGCRGRPTPSAAASRPCAPIPASILHLYRRLLAARRASPALREGSLTRLDSPSGVLAWERAFAADRRVVLVNFTDQPAEVVIPGPGGSRSRATAAASRRPSRAPSAPTPRWCCARLVERVG